MSSKYRTLLTAVQRCNSLHRTASRRFSHQRSGLPLNLARHGVVFCRSDLFSRFDSPPNVKLVAATSRRHYCCHNEEFVINSPYGDMEIPDITLHEYIWNSSAPWHDKVAVQCGLTGRSYTYGQARKMSNTIGASLQNKFGLKKGDCFGLALPNLPEYPLLLLGGSEAGLIITTINPIYTPEEIARQFKDADVKVVFTVPQICSNVAEAVKIAGKKIPIVVLKEKDAELPPGTISFTELVDPRTSGELKPVDGKSSDTLVLPYSSGTTGLPKGVELSQKNLIANIHQLGHPQVRLLRHTTNDSQDVVLGILPMFHIYGMVIVLYTAMAAGAKLVTLPKFDPVQFVETMVKYQTNLLYLVPPLVLFLGGHPAVKPEHLKSVRVILSGAAPIGEKDIDRLLVKGDHILIGQGYGLTETSPCILNFHQGRRKYASAGVPVPGTQIKFVDPDTQKALPLGETGELLVKGPQVMKGYYKNPEATANTLDHHGWLRTGDLGYIDKDGDVFIVDRLKELIKVKGFQVAPAELEEILRSHPKVSDAAVIAVKNEAAGELPRAFVVAKPGTSATEQEIKDFVAERVTKFKRLEGGVVFLDAIPKSAAGKILRKVLSAKYAD